MLSRRGFLAGSAALAACGGRTVTPPSGAPNVLVVLLDQLRAVSLPAYGDTNIATPAMDALLTTGVRFDTAIAANPLCGPARASLLTGMYPGHVGVPNNDRAITPGTPTLATVFRSAGYKAGYVGKWHLSRGKPQYPSDLVGFDDHFQGYNERYHYRDSFWFTGRSHVAEFPEPRDLFEPTYQTTQALEVLERWRDERFLLMVSYVPPHPPKDWRSDWDAHFPDAFPYGVDAAKLALRGNVPDWAEGEHAASADEPGAKPSPGARRFLRNYYGAILAMEIEIQRLVDGLKRLGLDERTVVVFTSDHGELGGSHGRYLKQKPYEESVRIPLGMRWTGTLPARTSTMPFSQVDLMPTLAGLCGVPAPTGLHGRDLSAAVRGGSEPDTEVLSGCHLTKSERTWWQVRSPRWSYTEWVEGHEGPTLYDMEADPFQTRNLADSPEHADDRRQLATTLAARRTAIGV
ncbi:MAG: sulfatase-like hydrolase/transferase [Myxococcales bacterium]|nr:sulfatase-like hydrolase/transferase [Myxococcales bacterium]